MSSAKRIIADALLLFSILWLPWWVALVIVLISVFLFEWFLEAVIAGFLIDSLYGAPIARFHGITFVATAIGSILLALGMYIRPKLRYYR